MISDIRLQQFRSYTDVSFEFGDGVNIIMGPNASGKTNLLEALLVLAHGSSYRARDSELIRFDQPWARLDGTADREMRTVKLLNEPMPGKTYDIDGKVFKRLSLQHSLPAVLFEPNHLQLLHGGPEGRRNYLDELLEQIQPGYSGYRRNYRRVLSHRNALLKRAHIPSTEELFPWNLRLSELGTALAQSRAALCQSMQSNLSELYKDISGTKSTVEIEYHSQFQLDTYGSRLLHKLETSRVLDLQRGFTAAGPHREDFTILFDGHPAEDTASRGETRTAVLALKILELEQLKAARGQTPLLLLDDVFSELDVSRRRALTAHLQSYQTFLTTTDAEAITKHFKTSQLISLGPTEA